MDQSKVSSFIPHKPSLDELQTILQDGLKAYFADVEVSLVDCPNFSERPFELAITGLHGKPTIADVGGGESPFKIIS